MELSARGIAAAVFDDCYHIACDFIKTCFEYVPMEAKTIKNSLVLSFCLDGFVLQFLLDDVTLVYNE
jgi:hypothetical protein